MKYIMLRIKEGQQGELTWFMPIIFPESGVHALVAEAVATMPFGPIGKPIYPEIVSAGSVEFENDGHLGASCFGASTSTGLSAHEDDATIICLGEVMKFSFDPRDGCKTYEVPCTMGALMPGEAQVIRDAMQKGGLSKAGVDALRNELAKTTGVRSARQTSIEDDENEKPTRMG